MRIIGGVIAVLAAFVYFHTPDGKIIAVDPADGQVILRSSPPGYVPGTMIEVGAGAPFIVTESLCEVAHALERKCNKDVKK
jgi:hypothetical protein